MIYSHIQKNTRVRDKKCFKIKTIKIAISQTVFNIKFASQKIMIIFAL